MVTDEAHHHHPLMIIMRYSAIFILFIIIICVFFLLVIVVVHFFHKLLFVCFTCRLLVVVYLSLALSFTPIMEEKRYKEMRVLLGFQLKLFFLIYSHTQHPLHYQQIILSHSPEIFGVTCVLVQYIISTGDVIASSWQQYLMT